jgi:hypothetical protein
MAIASKEQAEIIEPGNDSLQFDTVHQKDRQGRFRLANVIEESVL